MRAIEQHGTYQIVCRSTGQRYIGSTRCKGGFATRYAVHRSSLRLGKHTNPLLQAAWNRYGEADFHWGILDVLPPDLELCLQHEQMRLDACNPQELFNVRRIATPGGLAPGAVSAPRKRRTAAAP
jgi:hypothetical protein